MASPLSRRRLLGLAGGLAVPALAGCSVPGAGPAGVGPGPFERAGCVPRNALETHRTLAGLPLVYEVNGRRSPFRFDGPFFAQLEAWAEGLEEPLAARPREVRTYGSWTDGGSDCDSWHHAGRAFDLARLRLADGSEVSCRYDQWRRAEGARLDQARRRYWALAAGLHQRFAYVLTYLYDAQHANHIHIDNGRSGDGAPTFSARSRVQVQAVQAICRYLWSEPVELTGTWDRGTRAAAGRVLSTLGLDDDLGVPESWSGFLGASATAGRD
jgi:hypothetical protein